MSERFLVIGNRIENIGAGCTAIELINCGTPDVVDSDIRNIHGGGKGIVVRQTKPGQPREPEKPTPVVKYDLKGKTLSKFAMGLISAVSAAGIAKALGWV